MPGLSVSPFGDDKPSSSSQVVIVAPGNSSTTKQIFSAKGATNLFAGAVGTNASHSTFNVIGGDQINIYNYYPDGLEDILATLKPVDRAGYYVSPCLEGTREEVFKEIDQWLDDVDAPNILWLCAGPGAGKSTIASSLVSRLMACRRLGSSFFFRRSDVSLSNPAALWRTVAHDLAKYSPTFAKALIEILEEKRVDPGRPDIALHFQFLLREPLIKVYNSFPVVPVIIIDALDECDPDRSQAAQRTALLHTIMQWSSLPGVFKLIVTGRDERIPERFRTISKTMTLPTGESANDEANKDIRYFFEERFATLGGLLFPKWPGEQALDTLTKRAAGLFIWAETAVRIVEQGLPDEQLELVLNGDLDGGNNITKLYRQVLESSFRDVKGRTLEVYRLVVGTIILAKMPLHYDDLLRIVSQSPTSVRFVLDKLTSVISCNSRDDCVCFEHLSFVEFLCDAKQCPEEFFIDRGKESLKLSMACFWLMKDGLKFNICNLESSQVFNKDLPESISRKIQTNIPSSLLYSCRFWAAHLQDTEIHQAGIDNLVDEVMDFLYIRLLYWLEVMSLTEEVSVANVALLMAASWIQIIDMELAAFAFDASRFVVNFNFPISKSTPHIYLSALPFSPIESMVAKQYQPQFQNTLSIISGGFQNWPPLINIFLGHMHQVKSVAFSPNGKWVVSGSDDKTVCVWDINTSQLIGGPFEGHKGLVNSVAFSPDSKWVVSGSSDKAILVWDIKTGQIAAGPFEGHRHCINSVVFSADGKHIVSGSWDQTICIWDFKTGQIVAGPFKGHTHRVNSVAFSTNGRQVVSGSDDKTICVWDINTSQIVAGPFKGHKGPVNSVAFSTDGKMVVSGSDDRTVCVWNVKTGQVTTGPCKGHSDSVRSVAFSVDGKQVVSGSFDRTIRLWDIKTGQTATSPFESSDWVNSVAFSADGKQVVSGSSDGTISLWDTKINHQMTNAPFHGYINRHNSVAFSPDGEQVISCSGNQLIHLWDFETGQKIVGYPITGHMNGTISIAFSPDGKQVVTGSYDKTVCVWDIKTGQTAAEPFKGHTQRINSVVFSADGKQVVSGSDDKTICVWDTKTGQIALGPLEGHTHNVTSVAFSPDGNKIASGSDDKTIYVWDTKTGQIALGPLEGHTHNVTSVAFSPDGNKVVSGSDDKTICVWDIKTSKVITSFEGHTAPVNSVAFAADGRRVVSGSHDKTVCIWDSETGQIVAGPFEGHRDWVRSVAFSPDGKYVVSSSFDETIRVWDTGTSADTVKHIVSVDNTRVDSRSGDRITPLWKGPILKSSQIKRHNDVIHGFGGAHTLNNCCGWGSNGWVYSDAEDSVNQVQGRVDISGRALFWIPQPFREGLCGIETLAIFGKHTTRLDLSTFVYGTSWMHCHSSANSVSLLSSSLIQADKHLFPTIDSAQKSSSPSFCTYTTGNTFLSDADSNLSLPKVSSRQDSNQLTPELDSSHIFFVSFLYIVTFIVLPLTAAYYFYIMSVDNCAT